MAKAVFLLPIGQRKRTRRFGLRPTPIWCLRQERRPNPRRGCSLRFVSSCLGLFCPVLPAYPVSVLNPNALWGIIKVEFRLWRQIVPEISCPAHTCAPEEKGGKGRKTRGPNPDPTVFAVVETFYPVLEIYPRVPSASNAPPANMMVVFFFVPACTLALLLPRCFFFRLLSLPGSVSLLGEGITAVWSCG